VQYAISVSLIRFFVYSFYRSISLDINMNCPVCPRSGIAPDADSCPECGTDFKPIRRVHDLACNYYNQALSLFQNGFHSAAVSKLETATALDKTFGDAVLLHGKILWKQGKLQEAISIWERALFIDSHKEAARTLISEGHRHITGKKRKKAVKSVLAAVCGFLILLLGGSFVSSEIDRRMGNQVTALINKIEAYEEVLKANSVKLNLGQELQEAVSAEVVSLKVGFSKVEKELEVTAAWLAELQGSERKLFQDLSELNKELSEISSETKANQSTLIESVRTMEAALTAASAARMELDVRVSVVTEALVEILITVNSLQSQFVVSELERLRSELLWLQGAADRIAGTSLVSSDRSIKAEFNERMSFVKRSISQREMESIELIRTELKLTDVVKKRSSDSFE
jgi:tetratricopeptide (TPR) repeat protein